MPTIETKASNKQLRREQAAKAKQKKQIIILVCTVVVVAVMAVIVFSAIQNGKNDIFTNGSQTITLRGDGTFTAMLAHETRTGTYSTQSDDGNTVVLFTIDGETVDGVIAGDELTLPHAWEDGHSHGDVLKKKQNCCDSFFVQP